MSYSSAACFLLLMAAASACGKSNPKPSSGQAASQPAKVVMSVALAEGNLNGYAPAALTILPERSSYAMSFSVGAGASSWWFDSVLDEKELAAGQAALSLDGPEGGVSSKVSLGRGSSARATSGRVVVEFRAGKVSGRAETGSLLFDGKFDGLLSVSCWVPRSLLPSANNGSTSGGGLEEEPDVEDARFETAPCSPYRPLALR
jgi:hypothetical protein